MPEKTLTLSKNKYLENNNFLFQKLKEKNLIFKDFKSFLFPFIIKTFYILLLLFKVIYIFFNIIIHYKFLVMVFFKFLSLSIFSF